jgi:hypothetical protein
LLMTPPWRTWALPEAAPAPTAATTWVSLQLCTTALAVPSHTWPLPWAEPNPDPAIVTWVPGKPLVGVTLVIVAVFTLKDTELDHTPYCCTCAIPDVRRDRFLVVLKRNEPRELAAQESF